MPQHRPHGSPKAIRRLAYSLAISGVLNLLVLSFLFYSFIQARPPIPYCATNNALAHESLPLADQRGCAAMLELLWSLPFEQLVDHLADTHTIENGYDKRDLALATLIALHQLDGERGLNIDPNTQEKRFFIWRPEAKGQAITFVLYPGLTEKHWEHLIHFIHAERWPFTTEGLAKRARQYSKDDIPCDLLQLLATTQEVRVAKSILQKDHYPITETDTVLFLLDLPWAQWQQLSVPLPPHSSLTRRQRLLMSALDANSSAAASLLTASEPDFIHQQFKDHQVITLLSCLPMEHPHGRTFAKSMLVGPRSERVRRAAAEWLYQNAKEVCPNPWSYEKALTRFAPEKLLKKIGASTPSLNKPKTAPLPVTRRVPSAPAPSQTRAKSPMRPCEQKRPTERLHVVKEGDSLWRLSRQYRVPVEKLRIANMLSSDKLQPGTVLKIPADHDRRELRKTK